MQSEYKPTLRFDAIETRRINYTAAVAGLKPSEWIRKLILDAAISPPIADALSVRVAGFDEKCGWSLFHYADAIAHAETTQLYGDAQEIADYLAPHLVTQDAEDWIDGDKVGGVPPSDVTSTKARAIDLCRSINKAHIRALIGQSQR